MTAWRTARHTQRRFAAMAGSEQIACVPAIAGLIRWLRRERPANVLEVGTGIGTLTSVLADELGALHGERARLVSTEDDAWCRTQLAANLTPAQRGRVELVEDMDRVVPPTSGWDLVVIDGGDKDETRYFTNIATGGLVFFEKHRPAYRETLERTVDGRPYTRAQFIWPHYRHGYWLYKLEPNAFERSWFSCVRGYTRVRGRLPERVRNLRA